MKMGIGGLISTLLLLHITYGISAQRSCPRLQAPWNGQMIGSCNQSPGSECIFQCREPYILVGSRVRMCRDDGTWSGTTAACELDGCPDCDVGSGSRCVNLFNPENGLSDGQCRPGIPGQNCVFHCYNGYTLIGQSTLTCLNGGYWNSNPPVCRQTNAAVCEDILITNGYSVCTQEGGLTVCRITCQETFMIVGPSVVTCSSSGDWSDQIPICRRTGVETTNVCPTLNAPDGGRLVGSCTAANTGDTCQLVCLSGYRPTDTRILICQATGLWSNSLPSCVNDGCPSINVPQGSTSGTCSPGNIGQTCTITCNAGYTLTGGSGVLTCQSNGQWSGAVPTCTAVQSCPALAAPVSGSTSGTCSPGQVGQSCNFFCNSGYRLVGQPTLTCGSGGRWSGSPPYCAGETCPSLETPINGGRSGTCTQATVGQSCSFSCQAGYTLTGQSTLYCQAGGIWSSTAPTCRRLVCPPLTASSNIIITGSCTQAAVGEICTFTCQSGYTLVGQSSLYCQSGGRWSSDAPTCTQPTCPPLTGSSNVIITGSCTQAAVGEICTFTCQSGYTLVGQSSLYCQNGGRWSSAAPTCTRNPTTSCASLTSPNNGFIFGTCAPGQVGQTCIFGCNDGNVLQGQRTLTCLSSGQWSSNPPQCQPSGPVQGGNCPVLTPPPNGDFLRCDNSPGGQCIVICGKGYARSGSRVRTCLSQGTWSGYAPTCSRTVGYTTTYTYKIVPLWSLVFG